MDLDTVAFQELAAIPIHIYIMIFTDMILLMTRGYNLQIFPQKQELLELNFLIMEKDIYLVEMVMIISH